MEIHYYDTEFFCVFPLGGYPKKVFQQPLSYKFWKKIYVSRFRDAKFPINCREMFIESRELLRMFLEKPVSALYLTIPNKGFPFNLSQRKPKATSMMKLTVPIKMPVPNTLQEFQRTKTRPNTKIRRRVDYKSGSVIIIDKN